MPAAPRIHECGSGDGRREGLGISVIMLSNFAGSEIEKRRSLHSCAGGKLERLLVGALGLLFDGVHVGEDGEADGQRDVVGSHSSGEPHADFFPVLVGEGTGRRRARRGTRCCLAWCHSLVETRDRARFLWQPGSISHHWVLPTDDDHKNRALSATA